MRMWSWVNYLDDIDYDYYIVWSPHEHPFSDLATLVAPYGDHKWLVLLISDNEEDEEEDDAEFIPPINWYFINTGIDHGSQEDQVH